jgi:hypothetical protein
VSGAVAPLPYWQMSVFLCLGGNSTTWMNTAVLVTCIRNFRRSRGPVSSLLKGYVGLSTAIFTDTCSALLSLYCTLPPPPSARRNPFPAAPSKPYLHPHMPRPPQTTAPPSARRKTHRNPFARDPEQSVVASKWLWSSGKTNKWQLIPRSSWRQRKLLAPQPANASPYDGAIPCVAYPLAHSSAPAVHACAPGPHARSWPTRSRRNSGGQPHRRRHAPGRAPRRGNPGDL